MSGQNVAAMMQVCDFIDMLSDEWTAQERDKLLRLMNTLKGQQEGDVVLQIVKWTIDKVGTHVPFIRRPLGERQERLPLSL